MVRGHEPPRQVRRDQEQAGWCPGGRLPWAFSQRILQLVDPVEAPRCRSGRDQRADLGGDPE